jgi:segregation and condensation protein A
MGFEVNTEHFNGPFDLLLELIERRKLHVSEVSLAQVTDDFIKYVEAQEHFPMSESASFILVAATLILIKSKSLLPTIELNQEEQSDIRSLETRLAIYKRIREASATVKSTFGNTMLFSPSQRTFSETVFSPGTLAPTLISAAIQKVIAAIPKVEVLPKVVVKKVMSLEQMIERLTERMHQSLKMNFKDFAGKGKEEKVHVIVGFLAMLELVKRGIIRVEQRDNFDEIEMETGSVGVPSYN